MQRYVKPIVAVLCSLGAPAALTVWMLPEVKRHPMLAVLAYIVWLGMMAGVSTFGRALQGVGRGRSEQAVRALDQSVGRRVSRYGKKYRQHVLSLYRFMDVKGLATAGDSTPEFDDVFIDVSLTPRAPHKITSAIVSDPAESGGGRQSIWDFVGGRAGTVVAIVGAPGTGKTTLLQSVARRIAQPDAKLARPTPILLELRTHASKIVDDPSVPLTRLIREALPDLPVAEPVGWWNHELMSGCCIVLFDGLDEVGSHAARRAVSAWIEKQVGAYPGNDFVLTSRPHGYRTAMISSAVVLQVCPFTESQIEEFLHSWYATAERRATGTSGPDVEMIARVKTRDLLDRLAASQALSDLTTNPLLLTMIAQVHRYRGALPGSRVDLYAEVCQVMLWRRLEAKRIDVDIRGQSKEKILAYVAYQMMQARSRDIKQHELLASIRPSLSRVSSKVTPEKYIADVQSNGLLMEREHEIYSFSHHTFQEYLASRHIRDAGLGSILASAVEDPWWREVTLLYVAGNDADAIVSACLKQRTAVALSLAFDCIEDGGEVAPALKEELDRVIRSAFDRNISTDRRHVVAAVLARRLLENGFLTTAAGTRIYKSPVPASLYRLFLLDTGTAEPEGFCPKDMSGASPVTGVWFHDAQNFVRWLNGVIADSERSGCRLPTESELAELRRLPEYCLDEENGELAADLGRYQAGRPRVYSAWVLPESTGGRPSVWTVEGGVSPISVTKDDLVDAVTRDLQAPNMLSVLAMISSLSTARADAGAIGAALRALLDEGADSGPSAGVTVPRGLALGYHRVFGMMRSLGDQAQLDSPISSIMSLVRGRDDVVAKALDALGGQRSSRQNGPDSPPPRSHEEAVLCLKTAYTIAVDIVNEISTLLETCRSQFGSLMLSNLIPEIDGGGAHIGPALSGVLRSVFENTQFVNPQQLARVLALEWIDAAQSTIQAQPREVILLALHTFDRDVVESPMVGTPASGWCRFALSRLLLEGVPLFDRADDVPGSATSAVRMMALALSCELQQAKATDAAARITEIALGTVLLQARPFVGPELEGILLAGA